MLTLLLALACVPQERPWAAPVAPLESGLVRTLELEPLPGTFAQYLRLEREGARPGEAPLGLLRYVSGPDREGGVHVDLELQFLADGLRVFHTELAAPARRRVVFREVRAGAGRTLFLEGTPATGYAGYELGVGEVVRRERAGFGELPLLLIESVRLGQAVPEELSVLDPLSADFEPLRLVRLDPPSAEQADEHVLEARRTDGSLRWRVAARGGELTEWRFQERGPVARAITRAEFEAVLEAHDNSVRAAREAAAELPLRPPPLPFAR
jgi:hypothetical protein